MSNTSQEARNGSSRRFGVSAALLAFVLPFAITLWATWITLESRQRVRQERFDKQCTSLVQAIHNRMLAYEELLRAAEAFIASSESVTMTEWSTFVSSIAIEKRYPGVRGAALINAVRDDELDAYLASAKSEIPSFRVNPPGRRAEYYIVHYVEPLATNAAAIGLDLHASDVRRAAAERARDTLRPAITTRLHLIQDPDNRPGFLMLFPVYRREALKSPNFDRRRALFGWVDIAARVDDIMNNLPADATQGLSFAVYDGATADEKKLLYSSGSSSDKARTHNFETVIPLDVYGQPWAIGVKSKADLLAEPDDRNPAAVFAIGLLVSMMSAGIVWLLLTMRQRALALADSMTYALQASEGRIRSIVDNVTDGILTVRTDGRVDSVNRRGEAIFGRTRSDLVGRPVGELFPGVDLASCVEESREVEGRSGSSFASFEAEISVSRMTTSDQERFVVIVRDVTERKRSERESHLLQSLSLRISHAQDLNEAFTAAMKELCELARWPYAEAWLPDAWQRRLRPGACWHRGEASLREFADRRLEFRLAKGEGLPGFAWESMSAVFVRNLSGDPRFERTAIANDAGLRAALAVPVLADREVVAVLVFFAPEATEQIESYTRLVSATASQLGSVILRKRSEAALVESHNELQAVFDAATEISIIATFPDGVVRVFNQGAERMLGYKAEEVIGKVTPEIFHVREEIDARARELTAELGRPIEGFGVFVEKARRGNVEEREWTYVRKDGEHLTVTLAVNALRDGEGQIVGFLGIAKDVTLRNRAIDELRASESRVRSMIENSLGGLITCDRRGMIESINPAAETMFGFTASELIGRHFSVLLDGTTVGTAEEFTSKLQSLIGTVTELKGRRRNGEVFPFEISLFSFDSAAQTYFAGHILDVSKRHEVDRLKQDFVSTVSHELRTPLTSIRGALGLVASGALGSLEPEAKEMISVAERNSVRLISLINDILDFDRLESGRMEMHPRRMTMQAVIQRSIENVSTFADQEGVALEVESNRGTLVADEDRIVQVLVNFLSNAIKFSPQGSTVTVSSGVIDGQLECRVTDRGRGIEPEAQKKLFQRFQQADSSDSRRKGGTGLGLAISKAIVQQHGGTIGVESEPGKGSSFWFRIPAPAQQDDNAAAIDILVIEDDEALLKVLSLQLHRDDAVVRTATTCALGLAAIRAHTPDLLVLDIELPDRDGYSLVEELRRDEALRSLPLLVYTGQDLSYDQRNRLRLGPTRFLMKSKESHDALRAFVCELLQPSEQA